MPWQTAGKNRNNVISLRQPGRIAALCQPDIACGADALLCHKSDGVDRLALACACLYLDEDDQIPLAGDEINLPYFRAISDRKNAVTLEQQIERGDIFRNV